ncbi:MAG: hypothetical protein D6814_11420 [Calditrichaeota bacterium]|nr:MAG: hypothetical protein D6814_11420 [Calditrichota bacterium]
MLPFNISEFSNDTRYASAVARVRALEAKLLPARKFVRMADRQDWHGVLDELRGTEYADPLSRVENAAQLEEALLQALKQRHRLLHDLAAEPALINAILLWHDFNNLKILLQKEWFGDARAIALSSLGLYEPETLQRQYQSQQPLPSPLDQALELGKADFATYQSTFRVEMLLDKLYLTYVASRFRESNIAFLVAFIRHRIDLLNIRMVLRWRTWGNDGKIDWDLLPPGGFLDRDKLQALWRDDLDKVAGVFAYTPYGELFSPGSEWLKSAHKLWYIEKLEDDLLTRFCSLTRYTAFGIEPLIAYLWVSLQELKNMQLILTAKYMFLPPEAIKQRLRQSYG